MPSSYTTSLRLVLPVTGELTGAWGDTVNKGLTQLVEAAIAGTASVAMADANVTLTIATEAADQARNMFVICTGANTAQRDVVVPSVSKLYFVGNNTTGGFGIRVITAAGTGIVVPAGQRAVLYCDGTNVLNAITVLNGTASAVPDGSVVTAWLADLAVSTAKIAASAVTFAKMQNIATSRVLGRSTASSGAIEELSLGSNLTLVAGVLNAVDGTPAGAVGSFAMNTAPTGWLKANGAAVSRTTYATLFSAIGTTFGTGDGSTTFNLPDLRGEFIRGWDDSRGIDSGRVFGSAQGGLIESHTHLTSANNVGGRYTATGDNGPYITSFSTATAAAGGAETRPRNIALLACIKF